MHFELIRPGDLRAVWADVRAGLDAMPAEDWIAEDVFHAIRSGESALYVGRGEAGEFVGFVVLRRLVAEFSGTVSCHVWLAFNAGGVGEYDAALQLYQQTARQMGATRITFASPRPGWAKRYRPVSTTYEIPLEGA